MIYVLEDDQDIRALEVYLLKSAGYEVAEFSAGPAFEAAVAEQAPELVVLDIMLPGVDGLSLLRRLRTDPRTAHVPVMLVTAKTAELDKVEGLETGADDYLGKPFAMKELLARVRAMTRRQSTLTDNVLTLGNVTLNRSTFELSVGEKKVRLANKDFQMMEMLIVNPGQIISTDRFMEKVWGYDSETEIGVVWVYVSNLRKKLAALGADIEIKAVRNQGYSLEKK